MLSRYYRYSYQEADLQQSANQFARDLLVQLKNPPQKVLRDKNMDLQRVLPEINRNVFINGDQLHFDNIDQLNAYLNKAFGKNADLFLKYFDQGVNFLIGGTVYDILLDRSHYHIMDGKDGRDGPSDIALNVFVQDGEIYARQTVKTLRIIDTDTDTFLEKNLVELGPIESIYKLTQHGFNLVSVGTDSELIAKLMMGYRPDDSQYLKFNDEVIKWQKTPPDFNRVMPLGFRLYNALQDIYNPNQNRSNSKAVFGVPNWKNKFNIFEWLIPGAFGILTSLKNIFITFPCEVVPAFFEHAGKFLLDHAENYLKKPKAERHALLTGAAVLGAAVGALSYGIGKVSGFFGRRISSPIQSAKDSYQIGLQYGGKPLAVACAVGSVLITGALYYAAAVFVAAPLMIKSAVTAIKAVGNFILTTEPAVTLAIAVGISSLFASLKTFGKWLGISKPQPSSQLKNVPLVEEQNPPSKLSLSQNKITAGLDITKSIDKTPTHTPQAVQQKVEPGQAAATSNLSIFQGSKAVTEEPMKPGTAIKLTKRNQ